LKKSTYGDLIDRFTDMVGFTSDAMDMIAGLDYDTWVEVRELRYGVERVLELLGEATRGIPEPVRAEFPGIPWRKMMATRNILAHEYGQVDHEILYLTIRDLFPGLLQELRDAVAQVEAKRDFPLPGP
jgi:uncharacterized protein with HEPN domain